MEVPRLRRISDEDHLGGRRCRDALSALHFAVLKVVHVNVYPICPRRSQFVAPKGCHTEEMGPSRNIPVTGSPMLS